MKPICFLFLSLYKELLHFEPRYAIIFLLRYGGAD